MELVAPVSKSNPAFRKQTYDSEIFYKNDKLVHYLPPRILIIYTVTQFFTIYIGKIIVTSSDLIQK